MKKVLLTCMGVAFVSIVPGFSQINDLERATPESQGIPSKAIVQYFDSITSLKTTEIHSALLMRHGKVVGEIHPQPFRAEYGHTLFSCSKTFTAAAIGIAAAENRLRVTDRLAVFFPELLPDSISDGLAAITVHDLLTMQTGFKPTDDIRCNQTKWIKGCLANKMFAKPGTRFAYDSMDTYLLSAIITKVTGSTLLDYLRPRLFAPLHITEVNWEWSPEGISCGGWGLYLQAESMAKFGQLLLNKGKWNGRQLIPSSWVEEMMKTHVESRGYGYQMWRCDHPNTFRADGAYGQYIIVMPDEDMVAVITQSIFGDASGKEQHWLFKQLIPTLSDTPLDENKNSRLLAKIQRSCSLPLAKGKATSRRQASFIGTGKKIVLENNKLGWKNMTLDKKGKTLTLSIETESNGIVEIACGHKAWINSPVPTAFPPNARGTTLGAFSGFVQPFTASSSYGWNTDKILQANIHFVDWMSGLQLLFDFETNTPTLKVKINYEKKPFEIKASMM